jgi:8-oxo-dGTP pyrophosphatase MutT (NUDIX family)
MIRGRAGCRSLEVQTVRFFWWSGRRTASGLSREGVWSRASRGAACAQREFVVETGLRATIAGLLGIYSDPVTQRHRYADGDEVQFVAVVFEGTTDGLITREPDDEIASVAFFAPARLPLRMFGPDRPVVEDALGGDRRPFLR